MVRGLVDGYQREVAKNVFANGFEASAYARGFVHLDFCIRADSTVSIYLAR
jgi:hypothetical protein